MRCAVGVISFLSAICGGVQKAQGRCTAPFKGARNGSAVKPCMPILLRTPGPARCRTCSGVKLGSSIMRLSCRTTLCGMLSLSYSISRLMNVASPSSRLAASQSVLSCGWRRGVACRAKRGSQGQRGAEKGQRQRGARRSLAGLRSELRRPLADAVQLLRLLLPALPRFCCGTHLEQNADSLHRDLRTCMMERVEGTSED